MPPEHNPHIRREQIDRLHKFQTCFGSPQGKYVLEELARFCGAAEETYDDNPFQSAYLNGRRAVWLHIQRILTATPLEEDPNG